MGPFQCRIQTGDKEGPCHRDPEIRGWGGGGGAGLQKDFFRSFEPQFGLKIRGMLAPRAPPLDPPLFFCG